MQERVGSDFGAAALPVNNVAPVTVTVADVCGGEDAVTADEEADDKMQQRGDAVFGIVHVCVQELDVIGLIPARRERIGGCR